MSDDKCNLSAEELYEFKCLVAGWLEDKTNHDLHTGKGVSSLAALCYEWAIKPKQAEGSLGRWTRAMDRWDKITREWERKYMSGNTTGA